MSDRIPPRVDTPETVSVAGLPPGSTVDLYVTGPAGEEGAGTASVDGRTTLRVTSDGTRAIRLRGVDQTYCTPGPGPVLTLQARFDGVVIARSAQFAVSAIPENYYESFDSGLTGTFEVQLNGEKQRIEVRSGEMVGAWRGIAVLEKWHSDSGVTRDLECTQVTELVEAKNGIAGTSSGYLPGYLFQPDFLGTQTVHITPGYNQRMDQIHLFNDVSSKSYNIPVTRSGYLISRETDARGAKFTTCKTGQGNTVTGTIAGTNITVTAYSQAGEPAGSSHEICKTQKVH